MSSLKTISPQRVTFWSTGSGKDRTWIYENWGDIIQPITSFLVVQYQVVSNSWKPHGLQHASPPCYSPSPGACSNPCPVSQWCNLTISSSVICFPSCLQSFPVSGSFPMSWLFTSGGQVLDLQLQPHLSFPSPADHVLSELSTMTCPSWVALQCMAHSFIELHRTVIHVIILVSFLWLC